MPTLDARRKDSAIVRRQYQRSRRAEAQFARSLRQLARRIGELTTQMFDHADPVGSSARLKNLLFKYGQTLQPWAKEQARRMVIDVTRRDDTFWAERSKEMGRALKDEIENAPIGVALRERTLEAASYITSLPLEAAQRVEKLTVQMLTDSSRTKELIADIMRTGHVTKSRATLIARTEVSRTAGLLTQVRAEHVQSEGYFWRTAGDIDVREEHRELNGKFIKWSEPPVAGPKNMRYHAGQGPNCRCFAEVVIPEERM